MKHILLSTTALTMSAGIAAADVSLSGKANAGTSSANNVTTTSSGIDLNVSASITTDTGVTLTVADDFGGGSLIDYDDDYRVEPQTSDLDQPSLTVAMGNITLVVDPGEVDDLYDDSQSGDVQISTSMAGFSIDYVASSDTDANTNSYKLGYSAGDVSVSVAGTTSGDAADGDTPAENDAMKWSASYSMGDISLGLAMNNNGDNDDVTTGSVSYAMGNGLSVTLSADDNDDWDASVSWSAGAIAVSYTTDEESAYEANATYDLGGGAKVFAATTDANDFTAFGVEFTF
jgi:outer membrane protein OmpU